MSNPQSTLEPVARLHNATFAANTDLITDYRPPTFGCLRIGVAPGGAGTVFNVMISDGANELAVAFNSGSALTAGAGYTFTWPVDPAYSYNLQAETEATGSHLSAQFVRGGVV